MKYIYLAETNKDITVLDNINDSRLKYIYAIRTNDDFEFSNRPDIFINIQLKKSLFP